MEKFKLLVGALGNYYGPCFCLTGVPYSTKVVVIFYLAQKCVRGHGCCAEIRCE